MPPKTADTGSDSDAQSLEKVRALLLGSDRREIEHRFGRLERDLKKALDDASVAWRRELRELGAELRKELDGLEAALGSEVAARSKSDEAQATRLEAAKVALRARIDRVEAEGKERAKTLRERLSATTHKLRDELGESEARLLERITNDVGTLAATSASRQQLATLLGELAGKLSTQA